LRIAKRKLLAAAPDTGLFHSCNACKANGPGQARSPPGMPARRHRMGLTSLRSWPELSTALEGAIMAI
jgi:hypothetical protein